MATHVKLKSCDGTAYLTFYEETERRPCTLDWDVLAEFECLIREVESKYSEYHCMVIQSASPKSFVVGANIAVLQTQNSENIIDWVHNGHRIFNRLQELRLPVIAKVAQSALGGGLELAMACDFIVAGQDARFGHPEAALGVMPGWGGTYRLAMYVGPGRAKQMIMTAQPIDAQTAYQWGLVNHICANEELDDYVTALSAQIKTNDKRVLAYSKEIINENSQIDIARNAFQEATTSSVCMASTTTRKRLNDFFENRKKN